MEKEWDYIIKRKSRQILLAIKPKYATKIFEGEKKIELRKTIPVIHEDTIIYLYVSSPVMAICGVITIKDIIKTHPQELWNLVKDYAGVSRVEFETYFEEKVLGYGLLIDEAISIDPIPLEEIRKLFPEFTPPQNYRYIDFDFLGSSPISKSA